MAEEGSKAEPEHNIPLSGDIINGSCKALQPQRQLESRFSSERRWMECWLWAAVAVWGAMVVSAAVVSWLVWLLQRLEKYRAKYREKTSSFSTPNRGGFARYLLAVFFADVS